MKWDASFVTSSTLTFFNSCSTSFSHFSRIIIDSLGCSKSSTSTKIRGLTLEILLLRWVRVSSPLMDRHCFLSCNIFLIPRTLSSLFTSSFYCELVLTLKNNLWLLSRCHVLRKARWARFRLITWYLFSDRSLNYRLSIKCREVRNRVKRTMLSILLSCKSLLRLWTTIRWFCSSSAISITSMRVHMSSYSSNSWVSTLRIGSCFIVSRRVCSWSSSCLFRSSKSLISTRFSN